jgi:hypothetical protein
VSGLIMHGQCRRRAITALPSLTHTRSTLVLIHLDGDTRWTTGAGIYPTASAFLSKVLLHELSPGQHSVDLRSTLQ